MSVVFASGSNRIFFFKNLCGSFLSSVFFFFFFCSIYGDETNIIAVVNMRSLRTAYWHGTSISSSEAVVQPLYSGDHSSKR